MKFNHKLEDLIRNLLKEIPSLAENGCFGDFCSKVDSVNHLFLSAVNRKYPNIDDKSTTYIPTRLWEDFVERIEDASLKEKLQVFKKRNLSFFGKQNKPVVSFNTPNIKSLTLKDIFNTYGGVDSLVKILENKHNANEAANGITIQLLTGVSDKHRPNVLEFARGYQRPEAEIGYMYSRFSGRKIVLTPPI